MKSNVTRRQALQIAAAGLLCSPPAAEESELVDLDAFTPAGDPQRWEPRELACFAAAWELSAQQSNLPKGWRSLEYDGASQWRDNAEGQIPLIVWYGVGPAEWTAERMHELMQWLSDIEGGNALAAERIGRGRAFAIVSVGILSEGARRALPRPAFDREWQT